MVAFQQLDFVERMRRQEYHCCHPSTQLVALTKEADDRYQEKFEFVAVVEASSGIMVMLVVVVVVDVDVAFSDSVVVAAADDQFDAENQTLVMHSVTGVELKIWDGLFFRIFLYYIILWIQFRRMNALLFPCPIF